MPPYAPPAELRWKASRSGVGSYGRVFLVRLLFDRLVLLRSGVGADRGGRAAILHERTFAVGQHDLPAIARQLRGAADDGEFDFGLAAAADGDDVFTGGEEADRRAGRVDGELIVRALAGSGNQLDGDAAARHADHAAGEHVEIGVAREQQVGALGPFHFEPAALAAKAIADQQRHAGNRVAGRVVALEHGAAFDAEQIRGRRFGGRLLFGGFLRLLRGELLLRRRLLSRRRCCSARGACACAPAARRSPNAGVSRPTRRRGSDVMGNLWQVCHIGQAGNSQYSRAEGLGMTDTVPVAPN